MMHSGIVHRTLLLLGLISALALTAGAGAGPKPSPDQGTVRNVFLLVFDPVVPGTKGGLTLHQYFNWNDPYALADDYRSWVASTTANAYQYQIVSSQEVDAIPVKADGYQYDVWTYIDCINGVPGACHHPDPVDYGAIIDDHDLCEALNSGQVDEVWMFGGPYFGFWESTLAGPDAYWYNSPPVAGTSCAALLPIMGYNYERDLDSVVHNLGHRFESTMVRVYGSWQANLDHNWNRFALVDDAFTFSGCGSTHFPPNGESDYDYGSTTTVDTFCGDFVNYPDLSPPATVLQPIDCTAWGCDELGYLSWWFSRVPRFAGVGPDGKYNDWWRYIIDPNAVFDTDPVLPETSCSSEYAPGWCEHVLDGFYGTCNLGEWATAQEQTGWVRLTWDEPVAVAGVKLWDRACPEQVLSGHVELSDGAPQIPFGALEDSGQVATELDFSGPRLVSWIEIHLDTTGGFGANPGLGEIEVIYDAACTADADCGFGFYCDNGPACSGAGVCATCNPTLQCLDVWRPVLGCDGVTYSNACYARRACVPIAGGGA